MEFIPNRCEVMHLRKSNKDNTYAVNGRVKGILVNGDTMRLKSISALKEVKKVDEVVKKAHAIFVFIG